ncbi:FtsB family cell division protein [Agriterribacter sp.]|uniref:FtsB family cell division protein n=1 Tax=Agriterribacter sp. TaxID=2821509 RepID=UPI002CC2A881|nr:septum formation initiator family protein [Agriterribacter sp.]HTN07122.1 septum formation initiator family protein [Agriterribacter sp.]
MKLIKQIPAWLKNKYSLTLLVFVVWLVFFDHNDLFVQMERTGELRQLEKGKAYYTEQIEAMRKELAELDNDPASLEKAAREKYLMKRDSEDVFIIDEK